MAVAFPPRVRSVPGARSITSASRNSGLISHASVHQPRSRVVLLAHRVPADCGVSVGPTALAVGRLAWPGVPHHRHVAALAMRGGATVVGALSAYVLFQVWQRLEHNQRKGIFKTILKPQPELTSFRQGPLFLQRQEKHAFVTELFNADPGGPLVITGPQGSGKTMIVKRALSNRPQTVYLDLRAQPVASGTDLTMNFVQHCGYLLPPNELLGRAIFTRDAVGTSTLSIELDRALKLITDVLRRSKASGWQVPGPDGAVQVIPPLFCIDELNTSDVSALMDDPTFWRFIDWTLFLTDNRLAHVVFTTALDVAESLDAYPGFRSRRQKVHIDFPRPSSVHDYFHRTLNPFLDRVLHAPPRPQPTLPQPPLPFPQAGTDADVAGGDQAGAAVPPHQPQQHARQVEPAPAAPATSASPVTAVPLGKSSWLRSVLFGADRAPSTTSRIKSSDGAGGMGQKGKVEGSLEQSVGVASAAAVMPVGADATSSLAQAGTHLLQQPSDSPAIPAVVAVPPASAAPVASASAAAAATGTAAGAPPSEPAKDTAHPPDASDGEGPSLIVAVAKAKAQAGGKAGDGKDAASPLLTVAPLPASSAHVAATQHVVEQAVEAAGVPLPVSSPSAAAAPMPPPAPPTVPLPTTTPEPEVGLSADGSLVLQHSEPAHPAGEQPVPLPPPVASGGGPALPSPAVLAVETAASVRDCGVDGRAASPTAPPTRAHAPAVLPTIPAAAVETPAVEQPVAATAPQPPAVPSFAFPHVSGGGPYLLDRWEVDRIVETVGGHLKDLDTVVTAIVTGKSWAAALERLVADSVEQVERLLEQLLVAPVDGTVMPTPLSQPSGSGGGLGNASATGLTTGSTRRAAIPRTRLLTAAARNGQPLPSWDYQVNPRADRLASYARYLRAWALIDELSSRKYIGKRELADRIFAGCPHELEYFAEAGLILSVNVRAATRVVVAPDGSAAGLAGAAGSHVTQQVSLPGTYVTASSPRMRQAFRALVADPRVQAAAARARAALALAKLREEEALLLKRLPEAMSDRAYWQLQANCLVVRDTALRTSVAKELVAMMAAAPTTGMDFLLTGSLMPPMLPHMDMEQPGVASAAIAGAGASLGALGVYPPTQAEGGSAMGGDGASPALSGGSDGSAGKGPGATAQPLVSLPESNLLGVRGLASLIDMTMAHLHRAEEEVSAVRARLAEVRTSLDAAESCAEIVLPGTLDDLASMGVDSTLLSPGPLRKQRPLTVPRAPLASRGAASVGVATSGATGQLSASSVSVRTHGGGGGGGGADVPQYAILGFEFTALSPSRETGGEAGAGGGGRDDEGGSPYVYGRQGYSPSGEIMPAPLLPPRKAGGYGGSAAYPPLTSNVPYWRTSTPGRKQRYANKGGPGGVDDAVEEDHHRDAINLTESGRGGSGDSDGGSGGRGPLSHRGRRTGGYSDDDDDDARVSRGPVSSLARADGGSGEGVVRDRRTGRVGGSGYASPGERGVARGGPVDGAVPQPGEQGDTDGRQGGGDASTTRTAEKRASGFSWWLR